MPQWLAASRSQLPIILVSLKSANVPFYIQLLQYFHKLSNFLFLVDITADESTRKNVSSTEIIKQFIKRNVSNSELKTQPTVVVSILPKILAVIILVLTKENILLSYSWVLVKASINVRSHTIEIHQFRKNVCFNLTYNIYFSICFVPFQEDQPIRNDTYCKAWEVCASSVMGVRLSVGRHRNKQGIVYIQLIKLKSSAFITGFCDNWSTEMIKLIKICWRVFILIIHFFLCWQK